MSNEKQEHVIEKKKSDCGCGCIGIAEKKAKEPKSAAEKPKK